MKAAASKYKIIQVGMCLFTATNSEKTTFEVRTYNIYTFPREYFGYSPQLAMDASAIEFNMKHGMNFQKWFYEGFIQT